MLPKPWRWMEGITERLHSRVASRFDETWVPDYEGTENLSGELSHHVTAWMNHTVRYIGPLSRFADYTAVEPDKEYDVVIVLSGPEPQRTLLEQQLLRAWQDSDAQVLLVRGLMSAPPTAVRKHNITLLPYLGDEALAAALLGAKTIIVRSGYSTVMDLAALDVLQKAQLIPTPGQPEQEYLKELRVKS